MFSTSLLTWLNRRSKFCLKVRLLLSVASANEAKMVVAEQNLKKIWCSIFSLDAANFVLRMRRAVCPVAVNQDKI